MAVTRMILKVLQRWRGRAATKRVREAVVREENQKMECAVDFLG
jgi:hypothetical protein